MSISFSGEFRIDPPLTLKQYRELEAFAKERHVEEGFPSYYCQWVPEGNGELLRWSGGEKFRDAQEWLVYLIGEFFEPWGCRVNGRVLELDREYCEKRTIICEDNTVSSMVGDHCEKD